MKLKGTVSGKQSIAEVRRQFEEWRGQRKRGCRIPKQLWQAAVQLSERHSTGEIAAVLGLNLDRLEQQIQSLRRIPRPERTGGMEFVSVGTLSGVATTVVELENGSGRRLKVHLVGAETTMVAEVAKALWEQLP